MFFFEPLQGDSQRSPNLQRTSWSSIASIVPLLSSRLDVTTSRAVSTEKLSHDERWRKQQNILAFILCTRAVSPPHLISKQSRPCQRSWKHWPSSSSVIIERSNLSSCKPILNYCDVGLTIVIIAFGKTTKLVWSSCDPSDLKSRSFAISFTKPWQGGNGRGRAMQRMDISLE